MTLDAYKRMREMSTEEIRAVLRKRSKLLTSLFKDEKEWNELFCITEILEHREALRQVISSLEYEIKARVKNIHSV